MALGVFELRNRRQSRHHRLSTSDGCSGIVCRSRYHTLCWCKVARDLTPTNSAHPLSVDFRLGFIAAPDNEINDVVDVTPQLFHQTLQDQRLSGTDVKVFRVFQIRSLLPRELCDSGKRELRQRKARNPPM